MAKYAYRLACKDRNPDIDFKILNEFESVVVLYNTNKTECVLIGTKEEKHKTNFEAKIDKDKVRKISDTEKDVIENMFKGFKKVMYITDAERAEKERQMNISAGVING